MAINFNSFTEGTTSNIQSNDYVVGFDNTSPGGERKWTVSTLANAVSGIMDAQLNNDIIANTTNVTVLSASLSAARFSAKAWVNFNGSTTTPTVRSSYNVVSVTRATAGDNSGYYHVDGTYKINFATGTFANTNYAVVGLCRDGAGALNSPYLALNQGASYKSTSHIWVDTFGVDWNDNTEVGLIFIS